MAEDLPSQRLLEQLVERLDHLEGLLQSHTARLYAIERRLGIEPLLATRQTRAPQEKRAPQEMRAGESTGASTHQAGAPPAPIIETMPATKTEPPAAAPPIQPTPQEPQERQPHGQPHAWSLPSQTGEAEKPDTHSWMAEEAARTHAADEAAREPASNVGATAAQEAYASNAARAAGAGSTSANAAQSVARANVKKERKRRDLESLIGGVWFAWASIIAIVFGVGFALKYAIDNNWISNGTRVVMGGIVGAALLYTGERLRGRGLRQFAFILSGGGILILYLSDYAAYNFYGIIPQPVAFLLMAAVTAIAVALSVRLNALSVAILGLVGGFLTPLLLSTGRDNEVALFTYVALLDAGVLAVAYFKRWRSLDFLSFAGTVLMVLGWSLTYWSREKLWTTVAFLSVFFVLYSLLAVFHNTLARRASRWFDVSLAYSNASFYFGLSYLLLLDAGYDHTSPASQALVIAVFFTCLFYTVWRWNPEDRLLRYSYVAAAATFLTMSLAIEFELHWVTMAWAVEALMLTWVGLRSGERAPRHAALAVFCAALVHWFAFDMREFAYGVDPSFVPLMNRRALSCAVLVASMAGAGFLYRRHGELEEDERNTIKTFFALAGNGLALALLSLDASDYFNSRLPFAGAGVAQRASVEESRQFSLTAVWVVYAATMFALGVVRRFTVLRWIALLLLAAAAVKIVSFDSRFYDAAWHVPVANQTFIAYALLVAALAFCARLYGREGAADEEERSVMLPALLIASGALALAALSIESVGYFDRLSAVAAQPGPTVSGVFGVFGQLYEGKAFTLAVVWTLYGACAFLYGAWRGGRGWRWGGLFVLAVASAIVLSNLIYYEAPWHTPVFNKTLAAFAIYVAALWLVVRACARAGAAFEEASFVRPAATILANILALVVLSAEAVGFFDARRAEVADAVRLRDTELAKQLSLSVVWAVYGACLLAVGSVRRVRLLRLMALALLSLTTLKVFFWDLSSLASGYRIISFIVLGAILLVVSYLYQKSQHRAAEDEPTPAPETTEVTG
jgi:uncharacterized membrane protein